MHPSLAQVVAGMSATGRVPMHGGGGPAIGPMRMQPYTGGQVPLARSGATPIILKANELGREVMEIPPVEEIEKRRASRAAALERKPYLDKSGWDTRFRKPTVDNLEDIFGNQDTPSGGGGW